MYWYPTPPGSTAGRATAVGRGRQSSAALAGERGPGDEADDQQRYERALEQACHEWSKTRRALDVWSGSWNSLVEPALAIPEWAMNSYLRQPG